MSVESIQAMQVASQYSTRGKQTVIAAQRGLEKALERGGCSPEGVDWMIEAVDPFHDANLSNSKGFPDGNGLASCMLRVNSDCQVSAPSGLSTQTWDCHVINFPWLGNTALQPADVLLGKDLAASTLNIVKNNTNFYNSPLVLVNNLAQARNYPATTVYSGEANFDPFTSSLSDVQVQGLCPDAEFTGDQQRVIGFALEVRSVGPDINKSGTLYVWREPTPSTVENVTALVASSNYTTGATSTFTTNNVLFVPKPPTSPAEVVQIPTTRTLEAKEGAYVVGRMNTIDPPVFDSTGMGAVINLNGTATSTTADQATNPALWTTAMATGLQGISVKPGNAGTGGSFSIPSTTRFTNFDLSGVMIVGLNPSDVLNIKAKWIIQRFPSVTDKLLNVLGTAAPHYDPCAIRIYSEVMSTMPVGCPVRENGLGDWFKSAASAVMKIAPMALSLAGPKGKAIGAAMTSVQKVLAPMKGEVKALEKKVEKIDKNKKSSSGGKKK